MDCTIYLPEHAGRMRGFELLFNFSHFAKVHNLAWKTTQLNITRKTLCMYTENAENITNRCSDNAGYECFQRRNILSNTDNETAEIDNVSSVWVLHLSQEIKWLNKN